VLPDLRRLVWVYGLVLGAGLLLEGGALLLVDLLRGSAPTLGVPLTTGDTRHNLLHVAWGLLLLAALVGSRTNSRRPSLMLLVFGLFYTLLAVLGLMLDRPFGLLLGPGENAFHLLVGPLALALGGWGSLPRRGRLTPAGGSPTT
jgi:uncharacterized protein DUF4383